jgi:hypothetical protein
MARMKGADLIAEHLVAANKPFLLDVHVDAEIRLPTTGA